MKSGKLTKLLAMLIALTAVVITGCANESSSGGDSQTYKVEIGDVLYDDYDEYQTWRFSPHTINYYDTLKEKRDELFSKTIDGTYQDKGSLSAANLKTFLVSNGQQEIVAADAISFANEAGNEITVLFLDPTYEYITWVYIEKQ